MTNHEIYRVVKAAGYYERMGQFFVRDSNPAFRISTVLPLLTHKLLIYKNGKLRINRTKSDHWIKSKLESLA